jgi:hypothetical protein
MKDHNIYLFFTLSGIRIKSVFSALIFTIIVFGVNCSDRGFDDSLGPGENQSNSTPDPGIEGYPQAVDFISGEIETSYEKIIKISNKAGKIKVIAEDSSLPIKWELWRFVTAANENKANKHLGDINVANYREQDLLYIEVKSPPLIESILEYFSDFTLRTPRNKNVIIESSSHNIFTSAMVSNLIIKEANSDIDIRFHRASCDVFTNKGDISIELRLADGEYCVATTQKGNIYLEIPATTSAKVTAKSHNGTVGSSGLIFSSYQSESDKLEGVLGDGFSTIQLETFDGNITISGF